MSAALLTLSFVGTKTLGIDRTARAFAFLGRLRRRARLHGRARSTAQVAQRIERGLRWLPLPVECLDQAIVTWYALNLKGHAATMKVGMKLSPVSGHAWVACNGDTFVRAPGLEDFTVVAEFPPWP